MLVLTRKTNESVIVGEQADVIINVLESREGYVKLGFDAPRDIPVNRQEVYQRIEKQK